MMKKKLTAFMVVLALLLMGGVASASTLKEDIEDLLNLRTTKVELKNNKGEELGYAAFIQLGDQVILKIDAEGFTPGKHGFHVHQNQITENDFSTAGGHFNPHEKQHGHDNPNGAHVGDLPNLEADENGRINQAKILERISLEKGAVNSILGKSLIIHAKEDDGKSDPAGNAGDRVAGGNISERSFNLFLSW